MKTESLFCQLLQTPTLFIDLTIAEQDLLLRQLRKEGLLASFDARLREVDCLGKLRPKVRDILAGAYVVAQEHARMIAWEVNRIVRALHGSDQTILLLKGAAYGVAGLAMARGRIVADVDFLVPRDRLDLVEERLTAHGWRTVPLHTYDERYYREWMHELPPMQHWERLTEIDVHHTILPPTGRFNPDPGLLLESATPLLAGQGWEYGEWPELARDYQGPKAMAGAVCGVWLPAPVDMVLHAAAQLFVDSDFDRGMRDLYDLDQLLRDFGRKDGFWALLVPRALQLDLIRPLYYALRYTHRLLNTPIPAETLAAARVGAPTWMVGVVMDLLVQRALLPSHPEERERWGAIAGGLLYIRSHWLRMPPGLLFAHLLRKGRRRFEADVRDRWAF
ncbi:MAG: nucleotidyltransferase family protein [Magnetococcales bacterium]|nr:nucleotidyltransferase family protein [Magnetococcales bacterium]